MTRRITRALSQAAVFVALVLIVVFLADWRYRVLPTSIHSRLPSHHAGSVITDLAITSCSSMNPFSYCQLDPSKWNRIEKELYLNAGWFTSSWMHVQRKKEEELTPDDKVVIGIRVSRLDPGVGEKGQHNARWESRPGGIWILRSSKRSEIDSSKAVTAIDVLFGNDAIDPRPGWELLPMALLLDTEGRPHAARLSVRRGQVKAEKEVVPRVRKDGRFKILQVSDAHLSTGSGTCRDAIGPNGQESQNCEADPRTLEFIESILDDEVPDLVILSGDQVEGPASPDTQSAIFKIAAPMIERSIPYAAIFGNHDDEGGSSLSRSAQMSLMQTLPFSLSQPGPQHISGVGNYHIEVLGPSSDNSALTIYMLDSHSLTPDEKNYVGYDWIKQDQIDWFRSTAQGLKKAHSKYSHKHLDMAFIHIPLPEFADQSNRFTGGQWKERVTAPGFNSHFYDALAEEGVVAVGCGHDHVNDYCAIRPAGSPSSDRTRTHLGPWMCYAGGSGFGGYGGYGGYHRRVRVWEIDTNAGRMLTWKRVECCGDDERLKIDETVLVEGGVVRAPE